MTLSVMRIKVAADLSRQVPSYLVNDRRQKEKKKTAERTHPYINTSIYKYIYKYIDRWDSFLKIPAVAGRNAVRDLTHWDKSRTLRFQHFFTGSKK